MRPTFALALALFVAGCAPSDGMVPVAGTVTLDGKPVDAGAIQFFPTDGNSPTTGAVLSNGSYSTRIPLGKMKVVIMAPKVVGRNADNSDDLLEESIPAKYNSASTLTAAVTLGMGPLNFALSTK